MTDWRAACPWFWCDEDPQGEPPEVDMTNGGSVYASLGISGVFTMGSFDGQEEGVMTAGSWGRWVSFGNPTYTNRATGKIRTACVVALNDLRPVGVSRQSGNSEAAEWGASLDLAKIQTGGTVTHNSQIAYMYGPCLLIGRGNDGRMVPLILGNSIDYSNDESPAVADSRGNMGFWQRGFDDSSIGLPYGNLAVPGSRTGQQASRLAGAFQRRAEMLLSVETGVPFDVAVAGDENSALNDSVEWRRTIDGFADFINDTFGMPFAHRTMLPKVSYAGNGRAALADQTAAVDKRVETGNDLISRPGNYPTFQIGEVFRDVAAPAKWKEHPFTATVVGTYNGSGSIVLTARPANGTALIFGDGTAGVAVRMVNTTSANGGNWNVSCTTNPPAQAADAVVKAMYTDGDGVHPTSDAINSLSAPAVVTAAAALMRR
ncbi:MAG: hypothetical protein AB7V39_08355 [Nitrospiraceae bacterium]